MLVFSDFPSIFRLCEALGSSGEHGSRLEGEAWLYAVQRNMVLGWRRGAKIKFPEAKPGFRRAPEARRGSRLLMGAWLSA